MSSSPVIATLLCIIAHPDDETRLTGGVLAKLAAQGVEVHLLCLTRGEGGELGEPPLATRETLGQVRGQEMRCAAKQLGVASLTFLDYVDPVVGLEEKLFAPEHDPTELKAQIMDEIRKRSPDVVLTHGSSGEYGHPAHRLVHTLTRAAVVGLDGDAPLLYSFAATFPEHPYPRLVNEDDPAQLVVDVSPYLDQVLAAAECHRTQHALFVRRRSKMQGRPVSVEEVIRMTPLEGIHRHWPPANDVSNDIMYMLLA